MTTQEFSNEFDVLYNNIMSNQAPGLDEYEKSVFLTKAQLEVLKNHFNPKGNKYGEGFDDSPKRQIDFSTLITSAEPPVYLAGNYVKFDDRSHLYTMPNDLFIMLNETGVSNVDGVNRLISIIPIDFAEYSRLMSKPYKQPLKNQGWRLLQSNRSTNSISEVIVKYNSTLSKYKIRYVRRPKPIVLANLADEYSNISIEGVSTISECELDPILHSEILQRAVELAKAAYLGDLKSSVELGQRSE